MASNYPNLTPPINATGNYEVRAPFTVNSNTIYRCEAIRGFEELLSRNIDVFDSYYNSVGISFEQFERDLRFGINIVTLVDNNNVNLDIPSSYITAFPETVNIPHSRFFVLLDIGILPDDIDLSPLQQDLIDQVDGIVGNTSSSTIAAVAVDELVTPDIANTLAQTRIVNQRIERSNFARLQSLEDQVTALQSEIAAKDQIIIAQQQALNGN